MDILNCSVHSKKEAVVYCAKHSVLLCEDFHLDYQHQETTSIDQFKKALNIYNHTKLVQKTSTLLAKHEIETSDLFNKTQACLEKKKKILMSSLPNIYKLTAFKDLNINNKLENQFIEEIDKLLIIMGKFTEINMNAVAQLAW